MKKHKVLILVFILLCGYVVYKLCVLDIVFDGIVENEVNAWREIALPANAVQVREALSQTELLRQSRFQVIPLIIGFVSFLFIGKKKDWFTISKKGLIAGTISSFLLQGLHELLHGIAFPAGSTVYIGIIKGNFSGYAFSNVPMNMAQCIVYYLLPAFVLGILPLLLFIFDREKKDAFCWFCYGFSLIGLIQTAPD